MNHARQTHLDSLRGIAALIVVMVHYFAVFYPYTVFGAQENYPQHAAWENIFFFPPFGLVTSGQFAVCLFFILSGYVLSYSHLGEAKRGQKILVSILKRPIRLGGLVWFTIILGSLLWYCGLFFNDSVADITRSKPWFTEYWAGNFDFYKLLADIAISSFSNGRIYNPPLWTIKIELYGSIMVYLFVLLIGRLKYRLFISILLIVLFKDSLYQGFWIGLFIADLKKNHTFRNPIRSHSIYSGLLLILFFYFSSYPNYVTPAFLEYTIYTFLPDDKGFGGGYPMLSALLLFLFVITNNRVKEYFNQPFLQFLGRISYGLYIMHFLVLGSLSSWLFLILNSYLDYGLSFLIVLLSGLPLIIYLAYLATKYVDNPSIRLANYLGKKAIDIARLTPIKKLLLRAEKLIPMRST